MRDLNEPRHLFVREVQHRPGWQGFVYQIEQRPVLPQPGLAASVVFVRGVHGWAREGVCQQCLDRIRFIRSGAARS